MMLAAFAEGCNGESTPLSDVVGFVHADGLLDALARGVGNDKDNTNENPKQDTLDLILTTTAHLLASKRASVAEEVAGKISLATFVSKCSACILDKDLDLSQVQVQAGGNQKQQAENKAQSAAVTALGALKALGVLARVSRFRAAVFDAQGLVGGVVDLVCGKAWQAPG